MSNLLLNLTRRPETESFLKMKVPHPLFIQGLESVAMAHKTHGFRPMGLMLLGDSGLGKTLLLEHYVSLAKVPESVTHDYKPVLYINTPTQRTGSTKPLISELLDAIGDPAPGKGTEAELTRRFIRLAKELKVELIILDEIHNLLKENSTCNTRPIVNTIKNLMSNLSMPFVLSGLPSAARLGDGHEEFQRRFAATFHLYPFGIRDKREVEYFTKYMESIKGWLNKNDISCLPLNKPHTLKRFLLASKGKPALISALIEYSLETVSVEGSIDLELLAEAYERRIFTSASASGINPFLVSANSLDKEIKLAGL